MQKPSGGPAATPLISVVMANFEAGRHIIPALRSVLAQTVADLEVIVSDDGSRDGSLDHVRRLMAEDARVRLIQAPANGGPARCRNRALDAVRGRWVAIVDSDDIIHPERFERLLAAAGHFDACIVADDLMLFFEDGSAPRLLLDAHRDGVFVVSARDWILAGVDGSAPLGYVKPLIDASLLQALRYDEQLRIGEDFDLVLRLLLTGVRMVVVPEPFYLYRRHSASTSHRLTANDMRSMIGRQVQLMLSGGALARAEEQAFARRLGQLRQGLAYEELVADLKARRLTSAMVRLLRRPGDLLRLARSFREGRRARSAPTPQLAATGEILALGGAMSDVALPPYVPASAADWEAASQRQVWRSIAERAGRPGRCTVHDAAGRYAAGFIPEVLVCPAAAPSCSKAPAT